MKKYVLIVLLFSIFFMCNCSSPAGNGNGNNDGNGNDPVNPVPKLNSISPTSKVNHMPTFTLTASGTDFIDGSKILFNGLEKNTTYVSPTELSCLIDPEDITLNQSALTGDMYLYDALSVNVPVLVRSPAPGGGDSANKNFKIKDKHTFNGPDKISGIKLTYFHSHKDFSAKRPGYLYAVWNDYTSGSEGIEFSYSTDSGATWSSPERIYTGKYASDVKIDVSSSGKIYIVWKNIGYGKNRIYFSRSGDNGASWTSPKTIYQAQDNNYPDIFVDQSGNINVIWTNNEYLYFSRSTDNGSNWSTPLKVYPRDDVFWPKLTVDKNGIIYIVWCRPTLGDITAYFIRSTDNGSSWGGRMTMTGIYDSTAFPDIAVSEAGDIYMIYLDSNNRQKNINFIRSTNKGATWSDIKQIATGATTIDFIDIAVDKAGNIYVTWHDAKECTNCWDIYYSNSIDGGSNWSTPRNISGMPGADFCRPYISLDSEGNIYIICTGEYNGKYEISLISSEH